VNVARKGHAPPREQLTVARIASVAMGIVAVLLGITFQGQNVAFMVGLAFAIAASANFPALALSIFWRGCSTARAAPSRLVGTFTTLGLIYFSPTVQVDILKQPSAWFPLKNPALLTIPLSFAVGIAVSLLAPDRDAEHRFVRVQRQMHMGAAGE